MTPAAFIKVTERASSSKTISITIENDDEAAQGLYDFFEQIKGFNNSGSSRSYGILDPSDAEEKAMTFCLDGDGPTRVGDVKIS